MEKQTGANGQSEAGATCGSKSALIAGLDFISSSVAGMDPFWTVMAVFSFVLSLFGPWWFTLAMLFCAWQYVKMAGEI